MQNLHIACPIYQNANENRSRHNAKCDHGALYKHYGLVCARFVIRLLNI